MACTSGTRSLYGVRVGGGRSSIGAVQRLSGDHISDTASATLPTGCRCRIRPSSDKEPYGDQQESVRVREHLRGATRFNWNGLLCEIKPSRYDIERATARKAIDGFGVPPSEEPKP
jgi:hypothetical protein